MGCTIRGLLGAFLVLALIIAAGRSGAADEADPWAGIEEMVVVGSGTTFIDAIVPTSSVEFDAELLSMERISDIGDLANFTPNLQINTPFAASNPVIFIRGVGLDDFNANSAGAVAIYQDGIYMNSPAGQLFQFFDVKGASVLRGPQGGQYRNAGAGAILIESVKPSHETQAYATFTGGNYKLFEAEGAFNVPIIPDVLASRTSLTLKKRDGYTRNRCNGVALTPPAGPGSGGLCEIPSVLNPTFHLGYPQQIHGRANDANAYAIRSQLLLDVPLQDSEMQWLLNVHGGQNGSQASQYQHRGFRRQKLLGPFLPGDDATGYQDLDGDPFAGEYNTGGDEDLDLFGASLTGTWEILEGHTLTSITGYEWHDRDTLQNTDGSPKPLLTTIFTDNAWQFSQDLRLESDWTDALSTSIGVYFIKEDLEAENFIDQPSGVVRVLTQDFTQQTRSYSFYGSLAWNFFHRFSLDGTVRHTNEKKHFVISSALWRPLTPGGVCGRPANPFPAMNFRGQLACRNGNSLGDEKERFKGTAGSASLSYDITDDETKSVYVKYSRGWKPGHFNGGAFLSRQLVEPVDPETVDAFEGGFKTSWFDDRLSVDAAVFYYEYKDLQIFQIESDGNVGPIPQLINAQGAEIFGVELDLRVSPLEGLEITLNAAYLDTEYSKFETTISDPIPRSPFSTEPPQFNVTAVSYTGNRMVASPEFSMTGSVQYAIPLGERLGELTPRFSFSFKDDVFFDVAEGRGVRENLPTAPLAQKAYWILNASLTWQPPGDTIEVRAWVRNMLEEEYRVQSFDLSDVAFRAVIDAYGPPRTFGVTTSFRF